jgi:hypothetical protein
MSFCHGSFRQEFHKQISFNVPEDASHDFKRRSLHFQFFLPHTPSNPDLSPSDISISLKPEGRTRRTSFCGPRREEKHSVREEIDALAKSFTRPAHSISRKGGKIC